MILTEKEFINYLLDLATIREIGRLEIFLETKIRELKIKGLKKNESMS